MLAGAIQSGFLIWGFYASQPYLLELLDSDAVWIAGFVAAGVALATIVGNQVVRSPRAIAAGERHSSSRPRRSRPARRSGWG